MHCPKSYQNFREIFRVVSRLHRYISCFIAENRFPLGQCGTQVQSRAGNEKNILERKKLTFAVKFSRNFEFREMFSKYFNVVSDMSGHNGQNVRKYGELLSDFHCYQSLHLCTSPIFILIKKIANWGK